MSSTLRQLTNTEIRNGAYAIWATTIAISPILLLLYWMATNYYELSPFPNISLAKIEVLVGIITTFSITMTGFIAAIGAYILSVSNKPKFISWRKAGYLRLFYHLYAVSIVFLLVTFSACILMLLMGQTTLWLKVILTLMLVNFLHIALITISAINQAKNSA
jgi:hypothetical protein